MGEGEIGNLRVARIKDKLNSCHAIAAIYSQLFVSRTLRVCECKSVFETSRCLSGPFLTTEPSAGGASRDVDKDFEK